MRGIVLGGLFGMLLISATVRAGVVNPDISVIGQPVASLTNDSQNSDRGRLVIDPGETEFVFDAYLNPYSKGYFTLSLAGDGMELEEGYFTVLRGLPLGLNVKGGKYRVGFGRLNPAHPHTYPFAERFRVLAGYLPGEESFDETGVSISEQVSLVGDTPLTASVDYLQGRTFRIEREPSGDPEDPLLAGRGDGEDQARPAVVARLSSFAMLGEQSGLEIGASAARGTNNVAAAARTTILGGDLKAKLWMSGSSYLLLQGEILRLDRDNASWTAGTGYETKKVNRTGGYAFADYNFDRRHNAGFSYERFGDPSIDEGAAQALGLFTGYAVMEETLVFRLVFDHFVPEGGVSTNTLRLHVVYSMGPHKAHQF